MFVIGTRAGDFEEATAIDKVFAPNKRGPVLIGSVKSNMGHGEPVAALCSIIKASKF